MIEAIFEIFTYPFLIRAMIVGVLISLCAALLGVSLVLRRYSMIGDGLSHVGFGTLTIAVALGVSSTLVSAPIMILAAFVLLKITKSSTVKSDAAIALISTSALSAGVIISSLSGGLNTSVESLMFGSILAMSESDVCVSMGIAILVIVLFILFYNKLFAVTFDSEFSKATGFDSEKFNMLLAFLTAITIVIGMRMMGTLLISSLIVFPAVTSMRIFKTFKKVIISSAIVSVSCFIFGMVLSYISEIPTGAAIVAANLFMFIIFCIFSRYKFKLFTKR